MTKSFILRSSKKFRALVLFVLTITGTTAFGQSLKTEVEIFQEVLGFEKKVAVADFMNLEGSAEEFWRLYDEYEVERKKIGLKRIQVISEYARSYPNISDEKIVELFKQTNSVRKASDKHLTKYFKKMKKAVGASKAAQFWQLENYFNAMIQAEINSQLPFIGENLN